MQIPVYKVRNMQFCHVLSVTLLEMMCTSHPSIHREGKRNRKQQDQHLPCADKTEWRARSSYPRSLTQDSYLQGRDT
jgi:hypothetical protein